MGTKFIKLKRKDDQELVNPIFITRIKKIGGQTIVYTMDGGSIYTDDTPDEVLKKIKDSEKFFLDVK
jgi:hypothetical protein